MTIEEAAARLKELPGDWWWRVGLCKVSADAIIAPDYAPSDELRAFDERFNSGFDVDLYHTATRTYTCRRRWRRRSRRRRRQWPHGRRWGTIISR